MILIHKAISGGKWKGLGGKPEDRQGLRDYAHVYEHVGLNWHWRERIVVIIDINHDDVHSFIDRTSLAITTERRWVGS